MQHYKANLGKPEPSNESIAGNFTGQGILNGNLNISADVNFTRTFRDNDTAFLQGDTKLVAENEDTAVYSLTRLQITIKMEHQKVAER